MSDKRKQPEFWEAAFTDKREMWGWEPSKSAILTSKLFADNGVKDVLIPGIGYGRNASVFIENGMSVTGIEISQTAIDIADNHFNNLRIYHGSVTDMPYDQQKYSGIFCYALVHLLAYEERVKLVRDCYEQLTKGGYMVFTTVTKEAPIYGQGKYLGDDRYELFGGVNMYFYSEASIEEEFGSYGLFEVDEIEENYPFYVIKCRKP